MFIYLIIHFVELVLPALLFYLQGNGKRFVSVANAQCRRMITTLHAGSVGWPLANVTLILRIPVLSVGDGRPSNSQSLGGPW